MKGTFVAIDLLKDTDDSFKILEFNTALGFSFDNFNNYIDFNKLQTYISESNFSEVHFIGSAAAVDNFQEKDTYSGSLLYTNLDKWFNDTYSGSAVSFTAHRVRLDQTNIPFIADASDKFILRNAFDSSALIDSTYSSNNLNFLKLLKDSGSADYFPKTYFSGSEGFDTIGSSIRDNGDKPNFIIKSVGGQQDYIDMPRLYSVSGSAQLEALKGYVGEGEYLQEYIYNENDLESNKSKTYRTVGVLDSSLNLIDLGLNPYIHTNALFSTGSIDWTYDENGIGVLPGWERPKFIQKHRRTATTFHENITSQNKVVLSDGTLLKGTTSDSGSMLKSVDLPNLSTDNSVGIYDYSGSLSEFSGSTSVITSTVVQNKLNTMDSTFNVEVTTSEDKVVTFVSTAPVLVEDSADSQTKFVQATDLTTNHSLIEVNYTDGTSRAVGISNIGFFWDNNYSSEIDVEDADVFLIPYDSEDANVGLVIHNQGTCTCFVCTGYYVYDTGTCLNSTCTGYSEGCIDGSPFAQYCPYAWYTTTGCSSGGGKA